MKTLNTLQALSKLGKILSRIVFIVCLVGGIFCAVGIISLQFFPESFKLGGVTIHSMIETSAEISMGTCYASMAAGLILCAGECVLAKIAEKYFRNELKAGTPFTFDSAKELVRLGICAICIPIGTRVIAEIVYQVMANLMQTVSEIEFTDTVSVGLGVMMIVAGLLCKYGAELSQETATQPEN